VIFCLAALVTRGAEAQPIAVLSYNIHHAEGMDGKIDLQRIAAVIQSVSPDVVALQEVDRETQRSDGTDQAKELERLTGLKMVFGRAIDFEGGQYGNAILSRLPIQGVTNHPLPYTEGREPRAVLAVEVVIPGSSGGPASFVLLATHLDQTREPTDRLASAHAIAKLVAGNPAMPTLLAGDLNAAFGSSTMNALAEQWQVPGAGQTWPTIPVANPTRQIDFVLFRPADRWKVIEVRALQETMASDHRPILVRLDLLPSP
jgi:endonuclease/exonuclease/phosphatase family metal-dependent hydrolase